MPNHQPFTVIIPARNSAKTLEQCLEAVFHSTLTPAEVIVVNDGSRDETPQTAARFDCRVLNVEMTRGPMPPRLEGARAAQSPVLVFVDADVRVAADTFQKILGHFEEPATHAVTGLLNRESGTASFFSIFKNEYMNYIFKKQPRDSRFLYGSLWAIRKECLIEFEPLQALFGGLVSDSELGLLLKRAGRKIVLDHSLEVIHLKEYNLPRLLKNDFQIPFSFGALLARYGLSSPATREKRFSHISLGQTLATGWAFLAFAGLGLAVLASSAAFYFQAGLCLLLFGIQWRDFITALSKGRGERFALCAAGFLLLDQAVMFCGMSAGLIYGLTGKDSPRPLDPVCEALC